MFEANACEDIVSIVEALVFGANGACIDIGIGSLLGGIALFVGAVVALRFVGARVVRRILPSHRRSPEPVAETSDPDEEGLQRLPYESPIRSTGAWGGKPR